VATISHFAGELFKSSAGIKMVHLPYRGSAPAMNDLMGKHIEYHVDTVIAIRPQIEAGTVRPLAVFSAKRSQFLPDVPTLAELGYPNIDLVSWGTVVVPKGVPPAIRDRLASVLEEAIASPSVIERFQKVGTKPPSSAIRTGRASSPRKRRDEGTGPPGRDQGRVILT
jgi:Uncharacterized protein conserved in bacteria